MISPVLPAPAEPPSKDGILFVRTDPIADTMVKASHIAASAIILLFLIPIQSSASSRTLDLVIYPDGTTHVSAQIDIDPLATNYELELFGSTIDNFVAKAEDEFLLDFTVSGNLASIETFGSSVISVQYDTHDLVSKQGKIWTFSLDSPTDFTLLLPQNSVIVAMTNIPLDSKIANEQNLLTLSGGTLEIDYIFGTSIAPDETLATDWTPLIIAGVFGVGAITYVIMRKRSSTVPKPLVSGSNVTSPDAIFKLFPDIRQDDKEIVKFIFDSGGSVFESDLRKKFLQPRTTTWRAVKRLERLGIIETEKKNTQNLVKIRKVMEPQS